MGVYSIISKWVHVFFSITPGIHCSTHKRHSGVCSVPSLRPKAVHYWTGQLVELSSLMAWSNAHWILFVCLFVCVCVCCCCCSFIYLFIYLSFSYLTACVWPLEAGPQKRRFSVESQLELRMTCGKSLIWRTNRWCTQEYIFTSRVE